MRRRMQGTGLLRVVRRRTEGRNVGGGPHPLEGFNPHPRLGSIGSDRGDPVDVGRSCRVRLRRQRCNSDADGPKSAGASRESSSGTRIASDPPRLSTRPAFCGPDLNDLQHQRQTTGVGPPSDRGRRVRYLERVVRATSRRGTTVHVPRRGSPEPPARVASELLATRTSS